jgi:uncharacterized radical SAM superfamily Fe-S cluster-containing enzyme
VCLQKVPARYQVDNGLVTLIKHCPEHGRFATPVWRGNPAWRDWQRPKIPAPPQSTPQPVERGCPFDCGLCVDHRQHSCTILVEVTQRCDLGCPVCYAASGPQAEPDPSLEELAERFAGLAATSPGANFQLSGGEPTLRPDLPEIVAQAKRAGLLFVQLNTNGLKLGRDPEYAGLLKSRGLDSVFLQFDGADDLIYKKMRGRALLADKVAAIEACGRAGIGVVLVATVVPGVNDHGLGEIIRLAITHSPAVRGVHLQPISYFGRYPGDPRDEARITLPELMRAIEQQTGGDFPAAHFSPPGCENAMCSFSGNFLIQPDGRVKPLQTAWQGCCTPPEPAEQGARRTISQVARQWSAPEQAEPAGGPTSQPGAFISLDDFITLARRNTLTVSSMAFQDAWSLDLERVRDCCIHVSTPDGRLIPFCLYNLTSASGRRLYRP